MRTLCLLVLRKIVGVLVFAVLTFSMISFGVSAVVAADNPSSSAFKDPYNGGIKLPDGGGEPGKAYMAIIDAAYKRDHTQICKLM